MHESGRRPAVTTEYPIRLVGGGAEEPATVLLDRNGRECHLTLRYRDKSIEASATGNYFLAFSNVRECLEEEGLKPVCYGASLNVWPSGMAVSMGQGLKAYRTTIGKRAELSDLVDIFTADPDVIPATVAEQREFSSEMDQIGKIVKRTVRRLPHPCLRAVCGDGRFVPDRPCEKCRRHGMGKPGTAVPGNLSKTEPSPAGRHLSFSTTRPRNTPAIVTNNLY
jgi:hypothetical protein